MRAELFFVVVVVFWALIFVPFAHAILLDARLVTQRNRPEAEVPRDVEAALAGATRVLRPSHVCHRACIRFHLRPPWADVDIPLHYH